MLKALEFEAGACQCLHSPKAHLKVYKMCLYVPILDELECEKSIGLRTRLSLSLSLSTECQYLPKQTVYFI